MLRETDNFYLQKEEPVKSCLLALRDIILAYDPAITAAWRYKMPFFYYKGRMFCYLWIDKKTRQPYIGIVDGNKIDHARLIRENRSRMKIMLLDPQKDIPIRTIKSILRMAVACRQ